MAKGQHETRQSSAAQYLGVDDNLSLGWKLPIKAVNLMENNASDLFRRSLPVRRPKTNAVTASI
ncbi:hypothetical protein WDZ92_12775 [Nostoc sp. NIES-2111]